MKNLYSLKYFYISLLAIILSSSCNKNCNKTEEKPVAEQLTPPSAENKKQPNEIAQFPKLDLAGLSDQQKSTITKLFNDEICPCGCPKTFAECLNMQKGCEAASVLAKWSIEQLKKGAPERLLFQAVSEEINMGFGSKAKEIATMGAYRKGSEQATITIVEFADFECPACKIASLELSEFFNKHSSEVQIYFIHFPLSTHPHAEGAAVAAEAAGKQGKFWQMHDLLFKAEEKLTESTIKNLALKIFNMKQMKQFEADLKDPTLLQKVQAQRNYAMNDLKLMATPSIYFNGRPYHLSSSREGFELRVAMEKLRNEIDCASN